MSAWIQTIAFFSVVWVRGNLMRHNCFFSVRLLSVLRDHSRFSSTPERPMTYDFEGFSIPDLIHYIFCPIFILQKEPVVPFLMLSAKQVYCWYHFYNVFGMTYINHIHTVINQFYTQVGSIILIKHIVLTSCNSLWWSHYVVAINHVTIRFLACLESIPQSGTNNKHTSTLVRIEVNGTPVLLVTCNIV